MTRTRKPYSERSEAAKKRQCIRGSAAWKSLKERLLDAQGNKCFVSGRIMSSRQTLHHLDLDPEHYDRLTDASLFVCVSSDVHDALHTLYRCPIGWRKALENMASLFSRMDEINGRVDGKPPKADKTA